MLGQLLRLGLALGLAQALGWPLARRVFPRWPLAAWGCAAVFGAGAVFWLALPLAAVQGRHFAHPWVLWPAVAGVALVALPAAGRRDLARRPPAAPRRLLALSLMGLLGFGLALGIVGRNAAVDPDSERPMDLAFLRAYQLQGQVPADDPWLAGEAISYYDGGYALLGFVGAAARVQPELLLNLAVAGVFALALVGCAGLGAAAGGRAGMLLVPLAVLALGPADALRQLLSGGGVDWFLGARVIPDTITEFPWFSLLWGDLHPYLMAWPLWPLVLLLALVAWQHPQDLRRPSLLVAAMLAVGLLGWVHTWDLMPVGLVWGLAALAGALRRGRPWWSGWPLLAAWGAGLGLCAAVLLARLPSGAGGLGLVRTPSSAGDWLALALVPAAVYVAAAARRWRELLAAPGRLARLWLLLALMLVLGGWTARPLAVVLLALSLGLACGGGRLPGYAGLLGSVGFGLLLAVELVYVDDFYGPPLERMNTVFKLVMHAWWLLGVGAALLGLWLWRALAGRRLARVALLLPLLVGLVYPLWATPARLRHYGQPWSLDGERALAVWAADDLAAIRELRASHPPGVILEWAGDPYTWSGRFASFSGFPAVVGWAHHEAGWRGDWDEPQRRRFEVERVYRGAEPEALEQLLRRHRVRYLVVGRLEREHASAEALAGLEALGPPLLEHGETRVYRVDRGDGDTP